MKIIRWQNLDEPDRQQLLARPQMESDVELKARVASILTGVRVEGDAAVLMYGQRFDGRVPASLLVTADELEAADDRLDRELIAAIELAMSTVAAFHRAGLPDAISVETAPGVTCRALWRPLNPVGLYVPAGSAPLPSTAIMLGVPARLAGCRNIVLATPPGRDGRADPAVLAIAHRLGIDRVLVAGGAQAIAAMAYGTESVPACVKLFGPGNRFVTEAKRQVAESADGAAIDMPAGPSELMVIADDSADADFVAIDLLSQAEHGPDSQVFLVTDSQALAEAVESSLSKQLEQLPRAGIAGQALRHGAIVVVDDLDQAVALANAYAPEHLILASDQGEQLCQAVTAAGSVFIGHYTPESLGDYISGTNHVLPTGGWARSLAGLSATDFMRRMTVQQASADGLRELGPAGARLAAHEGLEAHRRAITLRLERLAGERI